MNTPEHPVREDGMDNRDFDHFSPSGVVRVACAAPSR